MIETNNNSVLKHTLDTIVDFGKYCGQNKTVKEIIDIKPKYIQWAVENIGWFFLDVKATKYLKQKLNP